MMEFCIKGSVKKMIGMIGFILLVMSPTFTVAETCGDVLSSDFVINELDGVPGEYDEEADIPCDFPKGTFVFWRGDQYDTMLAGTSELPDSEKVQETNSIASRSVEYHGAWPRGNTVEVGFLTVNKKYTAMGVSFRKY